MSEEKRRNLVKALELEGVIKSSSVKIAMLKVPREEFIPPEYKDEAYEDHPLPIPENQTISAPHMCAIMCEAAGLTRGDTLLEIGTGSGYHVALCSEIISPSDESIEGIIISIELVKKLAYYAKDNLKKTGYYERVHLLVADGSSGAPVRKGYQFKRIMVTAAAPRIPPPLIEQLADKGVMVIPVGPRWHQILLAVSRDGNKVTQRQVTYCVFVSLRGRHGHHGNSRENRS